MNTEEDEFKRIEAEAKRRVQDDDDTQGYVSEFALPNERNFCPRCGKRTKDIHTCTLPMPVQQAEPPPEWPLVKNILAEYGLDAISFVAEFKAAQRPWVGLTPEEILDLFDETNVYGSKWIEFARAIEAKLKGKNL